MSFFVRSFLMACVFFSLDANAFEPSFLAKKVQALIDQHEVLTDGVKNLNEGLKLIDRAVKLSKKLNCTILNEASIRSLALRSRAWNYFHLGLTRKAQTDLLSARASILKVQNVPLTDQFFGMKELVPLIEDFVEWKLISYGIETYLLLQNRIVVADGFISFLRGDALSLLTDTQLEMVVNYYFQAFDTDPKDLRPAYLLWGALTGMPLQSRKRMAFINPVIEKRMRELFAEQWNGLFPGM